MTKVVHIKGGKIVFGNGGAALKRDVYVIKSSEGTRLSFEKTEPSETINAEGMYILPAAFDIGAMLYDSSHPQKETELTAEAAAYFGGYSDIVSIPQEKSGGKYGAYGVRVTEAVKISCPDDVLSGGKGIYCADGYISDSGKMKEILTACKITDSIFLTMPFDKTLCGGGSINLGKSSKMLSDKGISSSSELTALSRDIILSEETSARVHFLGISLKASLEMLRQAKKHKVNVTSAVSPYHIAMTDGDVLFYGSLAKLMPPLRLSSDREALINGIADGTVDCIASLHCPCTRAEKSLGLSAAAFGASSLDIAMSAAFTYLSGSTETKLDIIARAMSVRPAEIFGQDRKIIEGSCADVILLKPQREITVTKNTIKSKSYETPLMGLTLMGAVKRI